ncbi:MAG: IS3 family transposase [Saprospiraceae bacterium]
MSIQRSCEELGYQRSTYYEIKTNKKRAAEREAAVESFVLAEVKKIRVEMPKLGGKKLYFKINQLEQRKLYKFGERKFFAILRKHNLLVRRRRKRVKTTDSSLWHGQYDDLRKELVPTRPEQLWVADITYFRVTNGFVYGHLITDAYSKKIVGYTVSADMKATSTLRALKMALNNRMYTDKLIHHSDRGLQYLSKVYTKYLKKREISISVTQDGSPYDNAVAERINGILKSEFGLDETLSNLQQVQHVMKKATQIYNDQRPHWSNQLLTPNQMHAQQSRKIITYHRPIKTLSKIA